MPRRVDPSERCSLGQDQHVLLSHLAYHGRLKDPLRGSWFRFQERGISSRRYPKLGATAYRTDQNPVLLPQTAIQTLLSTCFGERVLSFTASISNASGSLRHATILFWNALRHATFKHPSDHTAPSSYNLTWRKQLNRPWDHQTHRQYLTRAVQGSEEPRQTVRLIGSVSWIELPSG